MDSFTDVFDKSRELLTAKCFAKGWPDAQIQLQPFFGADGPDRARADVLTWIQASLEAKLSWGGGTRPSGRGKPGTASQVIVETILEVCKASVKGTSQKLEDVVALLKMLKHFYLVRESGSQAVWVVDNPKSYSKWTYDLFAGKSESQLKDLLRNDDEFFGVTNRQLIADSFQLAKKFSSDIQLKLSSPDARTRATVQKWFLLKDASDRDVDGVLVWLKDGFSKIIDLCNSNTVIFCDSPPDRKEADAIGRPALVLLGQNVDDPMERLPCVYIFRSFMKGANAKGLVGVPKLWFTAITIIHEFSHRTLNTRDFRYTQLLPGRAFSPNTAHFNAQSWEIFAADLLGILPP